MRLSWLSPKKVGAFFKYCHTAKARAGVLTALIFPLYCGVRSISLSVSMRVTCKSFQLTWAGISNSNKLTLSTGHALHPGSIARCHYKQCRQRQHLTKKKENNKQQKHVTLQTDSLFTSVLISNSFNQLVIILAIFNRNYMN